MTQKTEIEVKGESVEEAVAEGLSTLGLSRSEVEVIVVDEGRKGFLGLGNREAVVRLVLSTGVEGGHDAGFTTSPTIEPLANGDRETADVSNGKTAEEETTVFEDEFDELDALPDPELLEEEEVTREVLQQLLEKLGVEATVETAISDPDDLDKQVIEVNVAGEGLQNLIGRNGETLTDLQYITRLMVSQRLRRRVDFVIDVDGYRRKREEGLTRLAERMAEKVVARQRAVTLEPMSPYERRIIHMALRDHQFVYTKSVGSGTDRRIRIWLKSH